MRAFILFCVFSASPAFAQEDVQVQNEGLGVDGLGFDVGFSLLGVQFAPKYDLSPVAPGLHLRLPITFGSVSYNDTDDRGTTIKGDFDTGSIALLADYYPFGGGFRISGGLISGGYDLSTTTDKITDDAGNSVSGNFSINLAEKDSVAPVVSLGFARSGPGFGVYFDAGVRFNSLEVGVGGTDSLTSTQKQTVNNYTREANDDLSELGVLPNLSFGFSWNL